jgi:hypothetical protein
VPKPVRIATITSRIEGVRTVKTVHGRIGEGRVRVLLALLGAVVVALTAACGTGSDTPAPPPAPAVLRAPDLAPTVPAAPQGKPLLTLTGKIATTNADGALRLDQAALDRLGLLAVDVDDPWAKHRMALQGIRLRDLVALAGPAAGATTLHITALDDYQIDLNLADVRADDIFLAIRNGQGLVLPVEDGGPTRVVFADALSTRFSPDMWIWNIETIEVR